MQPTAQAVGKKLETDKPQPGRKKLAPNVSLVVFHVVLLEERQKLLLK